MLENDKREPKSVMPIWDRPASRHVLKKTRGQQLLTLNAQFRTEVGRLSHKRVICAGLRSCTVEENDVSPRQCHLVPKIAPRSDRQQDSRSIPGDNPCKVTLRIRFIGLQATRCRLLLWRHHPRPTCHVVPIIISLSFWLHDSLRKRSIERQAQEKGRIEKHKMLPSTIRAPDEHPEDPANRMNRSRNEGGVPVESCATDRCRSVPGTEVGPPASRRSRPLPPTDPPRSRTLVGSNE